MPGFLLHEGATVQCMHAGTAQPTVVSLRVRVSEMGVTMQPAPYTIAGCTFPPPPGANGPCVTASFLTASLRIRSEEMPVLLEDSEAVCAPTGTELVVSLTQTRVKGE